MRFAIGLIHLKSSFNVSDNITVNQKKPSIINNIHNGLIASITKLIKVYNKTLIATRARTPQIWLSCSLLPNNRHSLTNTLNIALPVSYF